MPAPQSVPCALLFECCGFVRGVVLFPRHTGPQAGCNADRTRLYRWANPVTNELLLKFLAVSPFPFEIIAGMLSSGAHILNLSHTHGTPTALQHPWLTHPP